MTADEGKSSARESVRVWRVLSLGAASTAMESAYEGAPRRHFLKHSIRAILALLVCGSGVCSDVPSRGAGDLFWRRRRASSSCPNRFHHGPAVKGGGDVFCALSGLRISGGDSR